MTVMECLKKGRCNAVTRAELVNRTGYPDRANRKEIERLRHSGIAVISSSDGKGYWLAESDEETDRFLREVDKRRESQSYAELRRRLAERKGLSTVHVRAHERRIKKGEIEGQVSL